MFLPRTRKGIPILLKKNFEIDYKQNNIDESKLKMRRENSFKNNYDIAEEQHVFKTMFWEGKV